MEGGWEGGLEGGWEGWRKGGEVEREGGLVKRLRGREGVGERWVKNGGMGGEGGWKLVGRCVSGEE